MNGGLSPEAAFQNGASPAAEQIYTSCSMCGNPHPHGMVDLRRNVLMQHSLTSYWKVPSQNLESTLACVCVQCVYKINAHMDMTRSLKIRLHRLTNGQIQNAAQHQREASKRFSLEHAVKRFTGTSPINNCLEATPVPENKTLHLLKSAASVQATEGLRLPTPILAADICSTTMPDTNNKYACNMYVFNGSRIPTPYSSRLAQRRLNDLSNAHTAKEPRQRYVVEVEEITPEKEIPAKDSKTETNEGVQNNGAAKHAQPSPTLTTKSAPSWHVNRNPSVGSNSRTSSLQSTGVNHSMLEVVCERPESALITESGGELSSVPLQLKCQHCARVYCRKDFYAKHIRRCIKRQRQAFIGTSTKAKSIAAIDVSANTIATEPLQGQKVSVNTEERFTVFHCSECAVTVENLGKLRVHKRIHLQRYYCDICRSEFTTKYECEFHNIECKAKHEVLNNSTQKPDIAVSDQPKERRVTRSVSRAASKAATCAARLRSNSAANTSTPARSQYADNGDGEECDEDDAIDDVSVADTMYTKRMRFTGDWLENHSSNNTSYLSLCDNNLYDPYDELQISTYKEYDLYLLDRLKAQVQLCSFTCLVPNCNFRTNSFVGIMVHDYQVHFKWAWFYCKKCGRVFTSKVFLDYHLDRQNGGRYICFKCGDIFEYLHQLERHFIRHTKCVNYRCNFCKFEFLTKSELLQHCELEQHDPNGERRLICIDPDMTIVNRMPPKTCYQHDRIHTMRLLNMQLSRSNCLRPLNCYGYRQHVSNHKIGDVLFKNQHNPNCWGWK